jgi:PAS domain S-box-containing protein
MAKRELAGLMETGNFLIANYDETTNTFSTFSSLGSDEKELITRWPAEKSLTILVIKHGKSMRFSKAEIAKLADEGVIGFVGKIRSESWVGVPLQNGKKVFGAMILQSYTDPNAYDDWQMEVLEAVGNQLSVYLEKKRAEETLRESEEMFRTFFEQNSVGFSMINTDGSWLRFNDKLCEMTGYSREELQEMNWRDFTPPGEQQRERPLLNDLISGKIDSYTIEKRCLQNLCGAPTGNSGTSPPSFRTSRSAKRANENWRVIRRRSSAAWPSWRSAATTARANTSGARRPTYGGCSNFQGASASTLRNTFRFYRRRPFCTTSARSASRTVCC